MRDATCTRCPLHQGVQNVCIDGDGSLDAELLLLGIAPGETEDRVGKPFQGRSGHLLRRVLDRLHLHPRIENVARCRPPGNRDPIKEEIEQCLPYLWDNLRMMRNLKVIVPLGAIPMRVLGVKGSVKDLNGVVVPGETLKALSTTGISGVVVPLMHPAGVLREQSYLATWMAGWHGVKNLLAPAPLPIEIQPWSEYR